MAVNPLVLSTEGRYKTSSGCIFERTPTTYIRDSQWVRSPLNVVSIIMKLQNHMKHLKKQKKKKNRNHHESRIKMQIKTAKVFKPHQESFVNTI